MEEVVIELSLQGEAEGNRWRRAAKRPQAKGAAKRAREDTAKGRPVSLGGSTMVLVRWQSVSQPSQVVKADMTNDVR